MTIPINTTPIDVKSLEILPPNSNVYVEDICNNYLSFISGIPVKVAVINLVGLTLYTILSRWEDKKLFTVGNSDITIGTVNFFIINMLMLSNWFIYGYWLITSKGWFM